MSQSSLPRIDTCHMSFCSISDFLILSYLILSYLICCFLPHANEVWGKVIFSDIFHSVHGEGLCIMSLPVWLPGSMFLMEGSLSLVLCSFLEGVSVQGDLCRGGGCLHAEGVSVQRYLSWDSLSGGSPDRDTPWMETPPRHRCLGVFVHGLPWTETPQTETPKDKIPLDRDTPFNVRGICLRGSLSWESLSMTPHGQRLPDRDPQDKIPLDRDTPWMETSPRQRSPWTETPPKRTIGPETETPP